MNEARQKRNDDIRQRYAALKKSGLSFFDAINAICDSPENKQWCLAWDTIRGIISYKHYETHNQPRRIKA
jgi:hypothetical protein